MAKPTLVHSATSAVMAVIVIVAFLLDSVRGGLNLRDPTQIIRKINSVSPRIELL